MSAAPPLLDAPPRGAAAVPAAAPPGATGERMSAARFAEADHLDDRPYELVRGWVVDAAAWMADRDFDPDEPVPRAKPRHGRACMRVAFPLEQWSRANATGTVLINDTGVVTEQDEEAGDDSVRGPDVMFYSDARMPLDEDVPADWQTVAPEVAFEVRSPTDRPGQFRRKAAEFLAAGSVAVVWVDPDRRRLTVVDAAGERILDDGDTFEVPAALPGFAAPVADFFRR